MNTYCPKCDLASGLTIKRPNLRKHGYYYRQSDSRRIQRFRCLACQSTFSRATHHPAYRQKKRQFNHRVCLELCSAVSMREAGRKLGLNRKTIARKLVYLAERARVHFEMDLMGSEPAAIIEFDELIDKEHSKCKPLSVPFLVEHKTRRILGFAVARIPCGGPLAQKARELYGVRRDESPSARARVLAFARDYVVANPIVRTDQHKLYPREIKRAFPRSKHLEFKGKRGSLGGQGELKKVGFDPLFSINHTNAMMRARVSRLLRKTWTTTKKPERLADHLAIFAWQHNRRLVARAATG